MVQVNEGWEDRMDEIRDHVTVGTSGLLKPLYDLLGRGLISEEEYQRCEWKVMLIQPFVSRMVLNMIKGTVKYPDDNWSLETWVDMGMDDRADSINYDLLEKDKLRRLGVL